MLIETHESTISPIPDHTEGYQKARGRYALVSSILFVWELIGFDITKLELPFKVTLKTKTQEAIPYALIVLILYFAFRTTIEWFQCHPERRSTKVSLIDFGVAHTLAISALMLYSVQRMLELQLADRITANPTLTTLILGTMAGMALAGAISAATRGIIGRHRYGPNDMLFGLGLSLILLTMSVNNLALAYTLHPSYMAVSAFISLIVTGLFLLYTFKGRA